jgi:hypothetical protein
MNVRGNYVVKSHVNSSPKTHYCAIVAYIIHYVGTMFKGALEITRA